MSTDTTTMSDRPLWTGGDGNVEAMLVLRVTRTSARKARTQTLNQTRSPVSTPLSHQGRIAGPTSITWW